MGQTAWQRLGDALLSRPASLLTLVWGLSLWASPPLLNAVCKALWKPLEGCQDGSGGSLFPGTPRKVKVTRTGLPGSRL